MKYKKSIIYLTVLLVSVLSSVFITYKINNKEFEIYRFDIVSEHLSVNDVTIIIDNNKISCLDNYTIKKINAIDVIDKVYLNLEYKGRNIIDMSLSEPFKGRDMLNIDKVASVSKLKLGKNETINIKLTYTHNGINYEEYTKLKFVDMKKL